MKRVTGSYYLCPHTHVMSPIVGIRHYPPLGLVTSALLKHSSWSIGKSMVLFFVLVNLPINPSDLHFGNSILLGFKCGVYNRALGFQ